MGEAAAFSDILTDGTQGRAFGQQSCLGQPRITGDRVQHLRAGLCDTAHVHQRKASARLRGHVARLQDQRPIQIMKRRLVILA